MAYKPHWHVYMTHFPLSLFGTAFLFQILHLFTMPECFELSTTVTLALGALSLIPTIFSGWWTWKKQYKSARVPLFRKKIVIAAVLLVASIPLVTWRIGFPEMFFNVRSGISHWLYFAGNGLLIVGATAEGFYGGQLNHH
ncbi:MAG: hypothetical protein M0Z60_01045 [Nitrospiraceae bacterium]|nr:hypothetical protein [Nitrospiraceae bacterium]